MSVPWQERLFVRALTENDAARIAQWRYPGRWRVYDSPPDDAPLSARPGYLAVAGTDGGPLVGFCCSGEEARVPGLAPVADALDIGMGMDPAYVGQGHGVAFGAAVVGNYRTMAGHRRLRAVVQSWNQRSLKVIQALGFMVVGRHVVDHDGDRVEYVVALTG